MFFYIIQTIFLLLIAFALGALVGYLLKRYFGCPAQTEVQGDLGASGSADAASSSSTLAASQASVSADASSSDAAASAKDADTPVSGLMASSDAKAAEPEAAAPKAAATKTASTAKKSSAAKTTKTAAAKKATAPAKKAAATKPAATQTAASKSAATKSAAKAKPAAKKPAAKAAAAATGPDDLKLIKGVGKLNETRLNEEGITTFAQVAAWKKADIAAFDEKLNFKGRIEREEWVPQAKTLAKDAAKKKPAAASTAGAKKATAPKAAAKTTKAPAAKTAAAKAPAKKAAAKKPAAKKAAPKKAAPKAPAKPDDLKLIKGVGKLIETKLAKEGITQYSQIAAWKKADIADFDEKLSFKGRIERDEWIAQAKILAKGGTTDFSKRAAKGDVPSSS